MKPLVATVRNHAALLVLAMSAPSLAGATDVRVSCHVDNLRPQVAEPFWLSLTVTVPNGQNVVFPEVPATIGPFSVLAHRDWFDVPQNDQRMWTRNFQLESLQGGELQIPPIPVSVSGQTWSSDPVAITVASTVEADTNLYAFRDIKRPIEIPAPPSRPSHVVALCSAATLLTVALAIVFWLRRRQRPLAPGDWALRQLDQLRNSGRYHETQAPQLVPEIAGILRQYIEQQFQICATRQTTDEFLADSQHAAPLTSEQRSLLQAFLRRVDEIKFARRNPEAGRLDDSYQLVQDFVRSTAGDAK